MRAPASIDLMNQDGLVSEKSSSNGLNAHEDGRDIVRLIQCPQCSRPLRSPITLPCGNSLCKECLPTTHEREHISYPDLPGRRQGVSCPIKGCGQVHPASDCSVDVALTKIMESIAEVMANYTSIAPAVRTSLEIVPAWDDESKMDIVSEKAAVHEMDGGRLISTYLLAAQGQLPRQAEVSFRSIMGAEEDERALNESVLQDILDSTQREVDCQVCYNLMLDPVTTFCGHTLCRKCMARVLDHSLHCPVCRRMLALPPSIRSHPSNKTLTGLLDALCPEIVSARRETVEADDTLGQNGLNTALFVCTLGFPEQPTFLRIFEPRYRLMLRRCLETTGEFGMLMYNRYSEPQGDLGPVHFYHIGTMLRIVRSQILPDGTSLVETVGTDRFRVTGHGTVDGYAIGSVETIHDVTLAEEEQIEAEETARPPVADPNDVNAQIERMPTTDLLRLGQEFVTRMQGRSANWLQRRVLDIHGQPPDDARLFPYWFASVLPISEEEKYKLLDTSTVRERLKITAQWIRRIESQRWVGTDEE